VATVCTPCKRDPESLRLHVATIQRAICLANGSRMKCEREGLDGIVYSSALKPNGANIVLFGNQAPACDDVELHEVTIVSYDAVRLSSWHDV
jgi:hypothetical protein